MRDITRATYTREASGGGVGVSVGAGVFGQLKHA